MEIRRIRSEDYEGLLRIQKENLFANLSPADRTRGFLTVEFTREQFETMDREVAVVVAAEGGRMGGFVCGSTPEFNRFSPLMCRMFERFDEITYRARPLNAYRGFIYGPVCIDGAERGRGLLRAMYRALKCEAAAGRYEIGTAFVAEENAHSMSAHESGLGMTSVGGFEYAGRRYRILAFDAKE